MAIEVWEEEIEVAVRDLIVSNYSTVLAGIAPDMLNVIPACEMQPRHDGDVEETQLPQNKNGVWFSCDYSRDIGQINGTCNRVEHSLEMIVWTLASQSIAGEDYPNPLSAGRRFHTKSRRAIQKILEDRSAGLPSRGGAIPSVDTARVYYCKLASNTKIPAKKGWEQCVMSKMVFTVRQRTITGRGA